MKHTPFPIIVLASASVLSCTLPSPCGLDEYLDSEYNICMKMTERTCSYYGNRDCYDPEVNEQKNVQSWVCELQDGTPVCLIDACQPNAVRSDDRHSCECRNDYYYDTASNSCTKLTGEHCGLDGAVNCYDANVNSQKNVLSWNCIRPENTSPICQVDSCYPNAERSDDRLSCNCMDEYYYDQSSDSCIKLNAEHCGPNGTVNCYDNSVISQKNVLSWTCYKPEKSEAICQVENCYANAGKSSDNQSCQCVYGYYQDDDSELCTKLSGEHCGTDGSVNCYETGKNIPSVLSWACKTENTQTPYCVIDTCIKNATRSNDKNSCTCNEGYYYDSESEACLKMSGHTCGADGTYDCYTEMNEKAVVSWSCELNEQSESVCEIDTCVNYASKVKHSSDTVCECNNGYYYAPGSNSCMKMDGHTCGVGGTYDCYTQEEQTAVVSWNCELNGQSEPVCAIDTCINNASRVKHDNTTVCECNEGYYYSSESEACLKMNGHTCGTDGTYDCYIEEDQTAVVSWSCELNEQSEPVCAIDTCINNASRVKHDNTTVCECNEGYYYSPESEACLKMDGHTCGTDGTYDCYIEEDQTAVVSWNCGLSDQSEPVCTIDTCINNASRVKRGQSTICECNNGYYYDQESNACLKTSGHTCGADGTYDCYTEMDQSAIISWGCELNERSESVCKIDACISHASRVQQGTTTVCECDFGYYYDESSNTCLRFDAAHCGNDGTLNCNDIVLPGVRSWKCEVNDIANEAYCFVNTCTRNANISEDKLSCTCVNNYYYDQETDKCLNTNFKHCGSYGTIDCTQYGSSVCKNNECYTDSAPTLCDTDEAYQLMSAHADALLYNINYARDNNACEFNKNMREAYQAEDVQTWCNSTPPCNSTDILTYCGKYVSLINDMIIGKIPVPEGYTTSVSDITLMVNIQLGKYTCE